MADFQYQAQAKLQGMLSSIRGVVAQAGQDFYGRLQGAQAATIQSMNDAYNRLVKDALSGQFDLSGINVKVPGADGTGASAGKGTPPSPPKPPSQLRTRSVRTLGRTNRTAAIPPPKPPARMIAPSRRSR